MLQVAVTLLPWGEACGSSVFHRAGRFFLAEVCDAPQGISVLQYNIRV